MFSVRSGFHTEPTERLSDLCVNRFGHELAGADPVVWRLRSSRFALSFPSVRTGAWIYSGAMPVYPRTCSPGERQFITTGTYRRMGLGQAGGLTSWRMRPYLVWIAWIEKCFAGTDLGRSQTPHYGVCGPRFPQILLDYGTWQQEASQRHATSQGRIRPRALSLGRMRSRSRLCRGTPWGALGQGSPCPYKNAPRGPSGARPRGGRRPLLRAGLCRRGRLACLPSRHAWAGQGAPAGALPRQAGAGGTQPGAMARVNALCRQRLVSVP